MAAYQELVIEEGADWSDDLLLVDADGAAIDLTGYTARCDIKRSPIDDVALIEMSTANGSITIDGVTGLVRRALTHAETADLTWHTAVHDMIVTSPNDVVTRICEGPVTYSRRVTA